MKAVKVVFLFFILGTALMFSGCAATFVSKDLPNIDYNKLTIANPKPNICLSTSVYNNDNNLNLLASALFKEKNERIFAASNLFQNVTSGSTNDGIQVKLSYKINRSDSFLTLVTLASFGIIPSHNSTEYKLSAEIWDKGKLLKTYEYSNSTSTWFSIFVIPFGEKNFNKVSERIIDSMSMELIKDINNDKLFSKGL